MLLNSLLVHFCVFKCKHTKFSGRIGEKLTFYLMSTEFTQLNYQIDRGQKKFLRCCNYSFRVMAIAVWSNKGKGSMLVSCHVIKPSSWKNWLSWTERCFFQSKFLLSNCFLGLPCENGNPTGLLKIPFLFFCIISHLCLQFPTVPFLWTKPYKYKTFIMKFLIIKEKSHGGMKTLIVIEPGKIFSK